MTNCSCCGACPGVLWIYPVTLHWENSFPFASRYQLQIASWLGLGLHVYFAPSLLRSCLAWTYTEVVCATSLCEFIFHQPHCVWKTVSVKSCMALALTVFQPPLHRTSKGGFNKDNPLRSKSSRVSRSAHCLVMGVISKGETANWTLIQFSDQWHKKMLS